MTANFSRRLLLKCAAAGTAAALPTVAQAAPERSLLAPAQLSDEEQLDACIAALRKVLARMYPSAATIHSGFCPDRKDGSFQFYLHGDVAFQPWQGDGIYLVSVDGCPHEYLVREERVVTLSGKDMGYSYFRGRVRAEDGGWDDFEQMLPPNFVRKLGEMAG